MEQAEIDFIDKVLQEWTPYVIEVLHRGIDQRKLLLTDDLYKSLRWEIIKASAGMVAQARLSFRMHGRYKDMRNLRYSKQPPVDVIIDEFIKVIGVSNFKFVPGYTAGKTIPTDAIAMRRIAWGISKSMLKNKQVTSKKWYSKNFYGTVNNLMDRLMASAQEKTALIVKENLAGDIK